jgi:SpoIIAA-like
MIRALSELPPGVIGFEAEGELRAADYRDVLVPAVEAEVAAGRDIRIVLVFRSWGGVSTGAAWEDMRMGVTHLMRWKRIALVTDIEWMTHLTQLFGWMSPGEVRVFPLAERDAAVAWAADG